MLIQYDMFWITLKDVNDLRYTPRPIVRPFLAMFCFNAPYQYTPLLNLRPFIFSLTPFGWMRLLPRPLLLYGTVTFYLRVLITPNFQEYNYGMKQGLGLLHGFFFNTVLLTAEGSLCWYAIRFTAVSPELRKLSVFWKTFDNVAHCFTSQSWRLVCTLSLNITFSGFVKLWMI